MMRFVRATSSLAIVAALAAGSVLLGAGPASALVAPPPSLSPSDYILGTTSSVLKSAAAGVSSAVTSAGRLGATLANNVKYSAAWKDLAAKYGTGAPSDWTGVTGADQSVIAGMEKQFAVPATKLSTLTKGIGSADLGMVAAPFIGASLGAAADGLFGVDVEGGLCTQPDDAISGGPGTVADSLLRALTGVDCDKWNMSQELKAAKNQDSPPGVAGTTSCWDGVCFQLIGEITVTSGNYGPATLACYNATGPTIGSSSVLHAPDGSVPTAYRSDGSLTGLGIRDGIGSGTFAGLCSTAFPSYLGGPSLPAADGFGGVGFTTYGWASPGGVAVGTVSSVSSTDGNPERYFRCTVTMTDGSTVDANSDTFRESDGVIPKPVSPAIPNGEVPASEQCFEMGGPTAIPMMSPTVTSPDYQSWKTAHPDCGEGSCPLGLKKGTQDCFTAVPVDLCNGWMQDPTKATDYTCTYDGGDVALSECYAYGNVFDPQKLAGGDPYADPATGLDTGTQTGPVATGYPDAVDDPATQRDCFPTGWGVLNPVSWVVQPVECALQWAFVPRASVVQDDLDGMKTAFDGKMPGQIIALVAAWNIQIPASGCDGITVDVPFLGAPFQIMQACPGDVLYTMSIWSRVFGDLMFTVYGVVALTRHVARVFGFGGLGTVGDDS